MIKKKLKISDFERYGVEGTFGHYFSYKEGKYEICLEMCLNGYDVGLYIYESLIQDKICTNLEMGTKRTYEALNKALKIANKLWKERKVK